MGGAKVCRGDVCIVFSVSIVTSCCCQIFFFLVWSIVTPLNNTQTMKQTLYCEYVSMLMFAFYSTYISCTGSVLRAAAVSLSHLNTIHSAAALEQNPPYIATIQRP